MEKEFWRSKTIWINALLIVAAICAGFADHIGTGGVLGFTAVVNIILRAVTKTALK